MEKHVINQTLNTEENRIISILIFTILNLIDKLCFLSIVSTGGSAYTRNRYETRLFKQQDPRVQVNTEGDPHPLYDPFQLDEGSPHGGCGRQVVHKVVSCSPKPLV